MDLEKNLKIIKDAEIDIEILKRQNEKLCQDNNLKIEELENIIGVTETGLEIGLKESGEDSLECKLGSVGWQKMPDEWKYQDEILMSWIISLPVKLKSLFLQITTTIKKSDLKKTIIDFNAQTFEKSKIIDLNANLYLTDGDKYYTVEGIEIKRQEPKFHYTIRKGVK